MKSSISEIFSQYIFPTVKGAVAAVLVFFVLIFMLTGEEAEPVSQEQQTGTIQHSTTERTLEQVREAQQESEPYYYDEYGVRYQLSDDYEYYYIDEDYMAELETPDSTAFTSIGYHPFSKTLWVVFRNTGDGYHYYDVPHEVWHEFKNADSKGSYFHAAIRGYYDYDRD